MRCPSCNAENLEGEDSCVNCGADLSTSDVPQPLAEYRDTVLGAHVEALVRPPRIVEPTLPVAEAIRLMHAEGTDCLLVCEGDHLLGIFTDRDAVVKIAGTRMEGVAIGDVMTPDPVVLRGEDTLAVAIHKMAIGGFRHIPIVHGGAVAGVVSAADVFRHLIASVA